MRHTVRGYGVISIHALREEGDLHTSCDSSQAINFYPRPPRGGRPLPEARVLCGLHDFYPRPPRGGRRHFCSFSSAERGFLSTPSARRATGNAAGGRGRPCDFYPRPPRGGRPFPPQKLTCDANFYPRPPRGGRRFVLSSRSISVIFLSTPSARRATGAYPVPLPARQFLSTPSARRATTAFSGRANNMRIFLSTPSARRATAKTETKSLFSNKLYNILHEFRRALICNWSKNYPNHAKRLKNPVRRCRKNAENSPFAPRRKTQNNSRPSCSKGG